VSFLFKSLTIKARIALISVVFVAGLAVIGGAYIVGSRNVAEAFADAKAYAELQVKAGHIAETAVGLKGVARDVRYEHESIQLKKFADGLAELSSLVDALAAAPRGEAVGKQISDLKVQIEAIGKQFEAVQSLQKPIGDSGSGGIGDRAESTGASLVNMLKSNISDQDSIEAERLLAAANAMRRAQAEYERTFDESLTGEWEVGFGRFDTTLKTAEMDGVTKRLVGSTFKDYVKSFKAASAAEADYMRAAERVSGGLDLIAPVLDDLNAKAAQQAVAAGARLAASQALTKEIIFAAMLLALLGGLTTALIVARTTAKPLGQLRDAMLGLAEGDLSGDIPSLGRADEIGQMARAVETFKDAALDRDRLEQETRTQREATEAERRSNEAERRAREEEQQRVVTIIARGNEQLANGNLTFRLDEAFPPAYQKMKDDFNAAIAQMQETMSIISTTTQGIRANAGEVSQASDDLSRRTEQQAASLEESAAALGEITATVKKAAEGANLASQAVAAADSDAKKGAEVVRQAVAAMDGISKSAVKINQIIGVIDEIAFQTNLLALNAGVEAARAGDTGRGFAVVAAEVRALAQRSAEAAKEIKGLISHSTSQVNEGVKLVGQSGKSLERVMAQVADLNAIIVEIAAGAKAQARGLEEVNAAISQMDKMTQQNAAMVEETSATSHSLSQETSDLSSLIGSFQVGDGAAATAEEADLRHQLQDVAPHAFKQGHGANVRSINPARPRGPTLVSSH
jgi:methyl-accepting chemotaxis protein